MIAERLRGLTVVFARELRHEFRSRQRVLLVVLFAALSTLVFSFALELDRGARAEASAGVLWATVVFASLLGFERQAADARSSGMREALLLAPISRLALLFGQMLSNWLFTLSLALLTALAQSWLFGISLLQLPILAALIPSALGIAAIGTLLSAMISHTRATAGILGVLMLPLLLPNLLIAVRMTTGALAGQQQLMEWLLLLLLHDFLLIFLSGLLYPYLVDG